MLVYWASLLLLSLFSAPFAFCIIYIVAYCWHPPQSTTELRLELGKVRLESKDNFIINQAALRERAADWSLSWAAYFCSNLTESKRVVTEPSTNPTVIAQVTLMWYTEHLVTDCLKALLHMGSTESCFNITNRIQLVLPVSQSGCDAKQLAWLFKCALDWWQKCNLKSIQKLWNILVREPTWWWSED